ncbi:universal stress protein [Salinisphaera sp. LB1]|uniref:universal stress protein n=1 Tax=Salinisphaera sp. LB1 TaxID=2183911 RepID=UPI000D705F95|nr:universal stress protein [Salinisphaera sp. LB1]AWN15163.1 Universal stress protein UspA and related nucleotide-binding protein [Salinisphaera sp. LB1]
MRYASLLAHVQDTPSQAVFTDTAAALAARWQAHVTGLHTHVPTYNSYVATGDYPVAPSPTVVAEDDAAARDRDADLARTFAERVEARHVADHDWRYRTADLAGRQTADLIAEEARTHDLVVLGRPAPSDRDHTSADTAALVAQASARPVLVLPASDAPFANLGRQVVLAWNASREAQRAISGALPLLQDAESVTLLVVDDNHAWVSPHGEEPGADIALYLARHGVSVDVSRISCRGRSVAEALCAHVDERGADLLCMGAYGHSRLREFFLGGTTYEMLRRLPVPTLIGA